MKISVMVVHKTLKTDPGAPKPEGDVVGFLDDSCVKIKQVAFLWAPKYGACAVE